jgi:hypothetical protein
VENEHGDYNFYYIKANPQEYFPLKINKRLYYGKSDKKMSFYITEYDKKILDLYNYPYEIINSIGIITKKKPLNINIADWYSKKRDIKKQYGSGSVEYMNIKIFLNSGYGVFAQSFPAFTKFSNFIYASYITAKTRYYILSLIKDYQKDIISISTDGILLKRNDKFIDNIKDKITDKLGDLTYEEFESVSQYANGIYLLKDKKKYYLKKRGYEMMKVEDLFKNEYEIKYKSQKPMRLIEGIIQKKYKEINDFIEQIKVFSPYKAWVTTNMEMAEQVLGYKINEFHEIQLDVPVLDMDKYNKFIQFLGDKQ